MATPSQLRGLATSVSNGRTFVRFQFDEESLGSLVADLNYASTQGPIQTVTQLKAIGDAVLSELKKNFPQRKTLTQIVRSKRGYRAIKIKSLRLREGWRVRFYDAANVVNGRVSSSGPSLLGFYIYHKMEQNERVRTILSSLEDGSKPYTITPKDFSVLRFSRNGVETFAKKADIPSRPGLHYLAKTEDFADQLLASRSSKMEEEIVSLIEKGEQWRLRNLTAASVARNATEDISSAQESFDDIFSKASNPAAALRLVKRRVARKRLNRNRPKL